MGCYCNYQASRFFTFVCVSSNSLATECVSIRHREQLLCQKAKNRKTKFAKQRNVLFYNNLRTIVGLSRSFVFLYYLNCEKGVVYHFATCVSF